MDKKSALFRGAIVLYFIIGLEILIMISPFAAFFYAAFNPFLLALVQHPATRWLTAFYLPHMVSPPDLLLKTVRVLGSVLFVLGGFVFLVCAGQVYYNKLFKKGVALKGLYSCIRHPQYLGLGLAGLGLCILWPRFLVAALLSVMLTLYYYLSKDEERRMLAQHEAEYREYMAKTGMFLPENVESALSKLPLPRSSVAGAVLVFGLVITLTLGGAFALRWYTINSLPLWSNGKVTALAILPSDLPKLEHRMASVLGMPEVEALLEDERGPYLVYFMPRDYIMQGMIADTGGQWKLYKHHHTIGMFVDWIFHPFRHLEGGCAVMNQGAEHGAEGHAAEEGVLKRMIFLRVETPVARPGPSELFGVNTLRSPLFMADVDMHNLVLEEIRELPKETGWGRVPTPIF